MEYQVLESGELQELVRQVNAAMKEGWRVSGGIAVVYYTVPVHKIEPILQWRHIQPMIRQEVQSWEHPAKFLETRGLH